MVALPQSRLALLRIRRLLIDVSELLETGLGVGGFAHEAYRAALLVRLLVHVHRDAEVTRACNCCLLCGRHRSQ